MKRIKRSLALLIALVMVMAYVPMTASAAEEYTLKVYCGNAPQNDSQIS